MEFWESLAGWEEGEGAGTGKDGRNFLSKGSPVGRMALGLLKEPSEARAAVPASKRKCSGRQTGEKDPPGAEPAGCGLLPEFRKALLRNFTQGMDTFGFLVWFCALVESTPVVKCIVNPP